MDGYGGYPGQQYPQTPAEFPTPMQRPPSQTNAQTPHPQGKNSSLYFLSNVDIPCLLTI